MRVEFAKAIIQVAKNNSKALFLTGDLGYKALEEVREIFGKRFLNCGVAEQNMVTVAAGLAAQGFTPWVYSITPFAVFRPFEQIRNDVCLHNLPVKIVGNGGGYGYGIMGATHHALEDVSVMRSLPNMQVYLPVVGQDVDEVVRMMAADGKPNYLRLNLAWANPPQAVASFAPWRNFVSNSKAKITVVSMGPVISRLFDGRCDIDLPHLDIWSVGRVPFDEIPSEFLSSLRQTGKLWIFEEHGENGGLAEMLTLKILQKNLDFKLKTFHTFAAGYPTGRYGSQAWHQDEVGLGGDKLKSKLQHMLSGDL